MIESKCESGGNMKVGIFLGYGPDTVLGKEGLGRYLGNLVKNLQVTGNQVTIACPQWLCSTITDLFVDFFVDMEKIELIVADKIPVIWRIYSWKMKKRTKKRSGVLRKGFQLSAGLFIDVAISITSFFWFMLAVLIGLCMSAVLFPFIVMASLIYWIFVLIRNIVSKCNHRVMSSFKQLLAFYEMIGCEGMKIFMIIYYRFLENVQTQLVRKINRSSKLDVWYSPAVFWPAFQAIESIKVINAPDLVTEEFATKWGGRKETLYNNELCKKTITNGKYFIVYANYIKDSLLIQKFDKNENNIMVIPHGINNMKQYITISSKVVCKTGMEEIFTRSYCKSLLQTLHLHSKDVTEYINGYCFDDVSYMFYPSQLRPHKNMLNLIKAYEYLLRKKYMRTKLFLTCNLNDILEVKNYIFKHRLQYDILCFNNVSIQQLAALYKCAELVVNPTLYEGGFPFTFGEGMSVGTPSVMSRIPQVTEIVDGYGWDNYLFDPYDYKDMADKILYGLEHREEMVVVQQVLFEDMKKRTWEVIGKEYVEAFQYFMELEKEVS